MNNDTLDFIKVLKLSDSEIWQYKDNEHSLFTKGPLEVLFSKDLNIALFKLNHFKYILDRTLKVVASSDNDKQFRSYLLPAGDGCHILKLQIPSSSASAMNFETIIENSCQLVRNANLEAQFQSYKDKKSGIFRKGENLIKETYIKGSSLVSKGIDAVIHRAHGENLNQSLVRKIEQIISTEKEQGGFETFIRNEAIELMEASNEFSKRQEDGFWNHFEDAIEEKAENQTLDTEKTIESSGEDKKRFQKLNEKGHALFDKTKESFGKLADKITGHIEITEEDKIFLRSDNFTDIGDMPYLPVDKKGPLNFISEAGKGLVEAAKHGLSAVASIIPGKGENKEEGEQKKEEIKDKIQETQEEKAPKLDQAEEFVQKASQKLEENRDERNLSSETTIKPNKEGPSPLDVVNEQHSQVADKVVEAVGEAVETKTGEDKSLADKVKEKASELKEKIIGSEEEGFKEIKSGFSETVEELRQERGEGEFRKKLQSKNPFENFAEESVNESTKLDKKAKGSFGEVTNKIGEKLTETKEKIKSVFVQPDKENAPSATA